MSNSVTILNTTIEDIQVEAEGCLHRLIQAIHEKDKVDRDHLSLLIDECLKARGKILSRLESGHYSEQLIGMHGILGIVIDEANGIWTHQRYILNQAIRDASPSAPQHRSAGHSPTSQPAIRNLLMALRSNPPNPSAAFQALMQMIHDALPEWVNDGSSSRSTTQHVIAEISGTHTLLLSMDELHTLSVDDLQSLLSFFHSFSQDAIFHNFQVLTALTMAVCLTPSEAWDRKNVPRVTEVLCTEEASNNSQKAHAGEDASLVPSSTQARIDAAVVAEIVDCLYFLCDSDTVLYQEETIAQDECREAAAASLTAVWKFYLEPRLTELKDNKSSHTSSSAGGWRSPSEDLDIIGVPELLEVTVSLLMNLVSNNVNSDFTTPLITLVEQLCASELAVPILLHQGLVPLMVQWLTLPPVPGDETRAAIRSLQQLTRVSDAYTIGWFHVEVMRHGLIPALADILQRPFIRSQDDDDDDDMCLAVAQILAALCEVPNTRRAVVEAKCFGFLSQHLSKLPEKSILSVLQGLVELVRGTVIKASEQREVIRLCGHSISSSDQGDALLE